MRIRCVLVALAAMASPVCHAADPPNDPPFNAEQEEARAAREALRTTAHQAGMTLQGARALAGGAAAEQTTALTRVLQDVAAALAGRPEPISSGVTQQFLATLSAKNIPRRLWPSELDELTRQYLALGERLAAPPDGSPPLKQLLSQADAARKQGRLDELATELDAAASLAQLRPEQAATVLAARATLAGLQLDWLKGASLLEQAYTQAGTPPSPRSVQWMLEAGDMWLAAGAVVKVAQAYAQAVKAASALTARDRANTAYLSLLAVSEAKLAEIQGLMGPSPEHDQALRNYQASLALRQQLAAASPSSGPAQQDLLDSQMKLALYQRSEGQPAALELTRQALQKVRKLAAADPGNIPLQRDLFSVVAGMSEILKSQGDLAGALERDQALLEISRKLLTNDTRAEPVMKVAFEAVAFLNVYQEALDISKQLGRPVPMSAESLRDISAALEQVGTTLGLLGDMEGASLMREGSQALRKKAGNP